MWGALANIGMKLFDNYAAENAAEDARHFSQQALDQTQIFNSAEAVANRNWQEMMSNTAMQRRKTDLEAAGFNPLLALGAGGAQTTGGGQASSGIASAPMASPTHSPNIQADITSAAQANAIQSQDERVKADIEKTKAEAEEIRARTPTHAVNIQATLQGIKESEERIRNIIQQTETGANTAQNIAQHTINLKAQIPQIEEHIKQLRALTTMNYEQAKAAGASAQLSQGQFTEVIQRVKANLPAAEEALIRVKVENTGLETPGLRSRANLHGGEHGGQKLGTVLELGQAISRMIPGIGVLIGGHK